MKKAIHILAIILCAILAVWTLFMCISSEGNILYFILLVLELIDLIFEIGIVRRMSK